MGCYVDDIEVMSRIKGNHLIDLKEVFDLKLVHQLKMNPTKFFPVVASGKFHGFIITSNGIHLDPEKVCAIQKMQPLRSLKELSGLLGTPPYIRRFKETHS